MDTVCCYRVVGKAQMCTDLAPQIHLRSALFALAQPILLHRYHITPLCLPEVDWVGAPQTGPVGDPVVIQNP